MFLVSCEKTDKGQTDEVNESEFVLADNVIILDESDFGKVVSCDGDNVVMTVSSKYDFAVGRIFSMNFMWMESTMWLNPLSQASAIMGRLLFQRLFRTRSGTGCLRATPTV